MPEQTDIASLKRWSADGSIQAESYRRLIEHPAFPAASRKLATNMLALGAADKALDGLFKDAGRYVAAMWALYLHITGGLTLARFKDVCASSEYLSPGRARALLQYLQHLDYLELVPARPGDPQSYVPTQTFLTAWRLHLRAAMEAASLIEPAVGLVVDRLDEPAILESVSKIQGEGLLASARATDQAVPFVRVFLHRYAGSQIVWSLLAEPAAEFPPRDPVPFSVAATARRFGVSRIHVKRLLDEAERAGLVKFEKTGAIVLENSARVSIQFVYAVQMIRLFETSAKTLETSPSVSRDRPAFSARR